MAGDRKAHRVAIAAHDVQDARGNDVGGQLASLNVVNGVISDGFSTTVLPAARAGATFHAAATSG